MKRVKRAINRMRFERAVRELSDTKVRVLLGQARAHAWRLVATTPNGRQGDVPGGPAEVWECGRRRFEIYDREHARAWR